MTGLETRRQLFHASGVFIALILREAYVISQGWLLPAGLLLISMAIGYIFSYLYRAGKHIPVFTKVIQGSERERDKDFPVRGALRFFTGALITMLLFRNSSDIVVSSIIVLSLADSATTLGGIYLGRHAIWYNKQKTIEGSISGFIISLSGLLLLTEMPIFLLIAATSVGVLVESLPIKIDDNITIPVAAGLTLWALTKGINI